MNWVPSQYRSHIFLEAVKKTIISNSMLCPKDRILIAVSGGSDSIALLHTLYFLSSFYNIELGVAHLDHKLRGNASKRDALFVKSVVRNFNIPYYISDADVSKVKHKLKLSVEESARKIRYAFLNKIRLKYSFSKIALAHHMDDNAELILMSMIRGSGVTGLSGIQPIRNDLFIRPFIKTHKFQILRFLLDEKISYIEDESNNDLKFTRNKIRHFLMPLLKKTFNPKIINNLNRMATLMNDENKYMKKIVSVEYDNVLINSGKKILFSVPKFSQLHVSIKRKIIRKALLTLTGSLKRISFTHIEAVIELIKNNSGTKRLNLPNYIEVSKVYEVLEIKRKIKYESRVNYNSKLPSIFYKKLNASDFPLVLEDKYYRFNFTLSKRNDNFLWKNVDKNIAFFDLRLLQFPLIVRYSINGDKINPLGMCGNQKLRKYFINKKIPLSQRSKMLVIDDNGIVIWLVNHIVCDYAKVTVKTKDILTIKFCSLKAK